MRAFALSLQLLCSFAVVTSPLFRRCHGEVFRGSIGGNSYMKNDPDAVPTFLIIGTAKGGTTDLYEQLADVNANSDPTRPDPPIIRAVRKEFNYLAREEMKQPDLLPGGVKMAEYMGRLGHPCTNVTPASELPACIRRAAESNMTVDATPVNLFGPLAPVNLQMLSPNSKVIVMLRDPIERAEVLYRHVCIDEGEWKRGTIDNLTEVFFRFVETQPGIKDALNTIAKCPDTKCMADNWRAMKALNMYSPKEVKHFSGALYAYCLAMWQEHYFKPGRVMIIDSHLYFRNRFGVLKEVINFLYGRPMTGLEQSLARQASFWRKGPKALSRAGTNWILSPQAREQLRVFYSDHVSRHLGKVLYQLRQKGAVVLGFNGEPWTYDTAFQPLR